MPPFVDQMPKKQREELKEVWKNYQLGKNCGMEQAKTFEIVGKLSAEDKIRIFGAPPNNAIPPPGYLDNHCSTLTLIYEYS